MMRKIVPFSVNYLTLKKISLAGSLILYTSAMLSLLIILNEKLQPSNKDYLGMVFNSLLSFFSLAYFIQDLLHNYLFQLSEVHRRNDFIDNSFSTTLCDKNSEGYFTNDNLISGVYKLGVNCFENSFFTKAVSLAMIPALLIKSIIIILLFILIVLFTDRQTIIVLMQVALPLTILQQSVRLIVLHFRINSIYKQFKFIFTTNSPEIRDSYIITNVINYESTIAWAGISLDSKKFDKLNDSLTQEWEGIKIRHKIK